MRCLSKASPRRSWPRGSSREFLSLDLLKELEMWRGGAGGRAGRQGGKRGRRKTSGVCLPLRAEPSANRQGAAWAAGGHKGASIATTQASALLRSLWKHLPAVQRGGSRRLPAERRCAKPVSEDQAFVFLLTHRGNKVFVGTQGFHAALVLVVPNP